MPPGGRTGFGMAASFCTPEGPGSGMTFLGGTISPIVEEGRSPPGGRSPLADGGRIPVAGGGRAALLGGRRRLWGAAILLGGRSPLGWPRSGLRRS